METIYTETDCFLCYFSICRYAAVWGRDESAGLEKNLGEIMWCPQELSEWTTENLFWLFLFHSVAYQFEIMNNTTKIMYSFGARAAWKFSCDSPNEINDNCSRTSLINKESSEQWSLPKRTVSSLPWVQHQENITGKSLILGPRTTKRDGGHNI